MRGKTLFFSAWSLLLVSLLTACFNGGGGGSNSTSSSGLNADGIAPELLFTPSLLTVDSGSSTTATLTATDNVGIATLETVCSNGGNFNKNTNTFVAPTVSSEIISVCTTTATDTSGNQAQIDLTVRVRPSTMTSCTRALPAVTADTCDVTVGSGNGLLLRGDVVFPSELVSNAEVLIDDGVIVCSGCDCSAETAFAEATVFTCTDAVIAPGLINGRESLTFSFNPPFNNTDRYQHRHDWRIGQRGGAQLQSPYRGNTDQVSWGEIRSVMAGVTSSVGSAEQLGMIRNLDRDDFIAALLPENIPPGGYVAEIGANGFDKEGTVLQTFPLGDTNGRQLTNSCDYSDFPKESDFRRESILASQLDLDYLGRMMQLVVPEDTVIGPTPMVLTVAEGIDAVARNEFLCLSDTGQGGVDFLGVNTAMVSAAGLTAQDITRIVQKGAGLIWTPRSDTSLYGNTAMVPVFKNESAMIGLGTNFIPSGSVHIGRELACAADWNQRWGGNVFTQHELVSLATINNATLAGYGDLIGSLDVGKIADIAIWKTENNNGLNTMLTAKNENVALVLRGGVPLYGDDNLIQALAASDNCEPVNVCGESRRLCANRELGISLTDIMASAPVGASELFVCDNAWSNEPTCLPSRISPDAYNGLSVVGDIDGDGVSDNNDNCVGVFNPPTPLKPSVQADSDNDGIGDLCDF